jgi:hypothetical protein
MATGLIFFMTFYGIAAWSQKGAGTRTAVNISFSLAVVLAWTWISTLANRLKRLE